MCQFSLLKKLLTVVGQCANDILEDISGCVASLILHFPYSTSKDCVNQRGQVGTIMMIFKYFFLACSVSLTGFINTNSFVCLNKKLL